MKKYLLFLFALTCLYGGSANECMSDIYFANGVGAVSWNISFDDGRKQLLKSMQKAQLKS